VKTPIKIVIIFLTVFLAIFSEGCLRTTLSTRPFYTEGLAQGTQYTIEARLPYWIPSAWVRHRFDRIFDTIDIQVSTYRPDSEISRFNAHQEATPFRISHEFYTLIRFGNELYRLSDGYWDGTIYSITPMHPIQPGMSQLMIRQSTITKRTPYLKITLDSIAQGYTVDLIMNHLIRWGATSAKVELGGEVRVYSKQNQAFEVKIATPYSRYTRSTASVWLRNEAISTSGIDNHGFHIINPHTHRKSTPKTQAIVVIAPTTVLADGLSTTLFAMPPHQHQAFLAQFPRVRAYKVTNTVLRPLVTP
jgi:thiamine biosynthesis lipoprotein